MKSTEEQLEDLWKDMDRAHSRYEELREKLKETRQILSNVFLAWTKEANEQGGIWEEHSSVYETVKALLTKGNTV